MDKRFKHIKCPITIMIWRYLHLCQSFALHISYEVRDGSEAFGLLCRYGVLKIVYRFPDSELEQAPDLDALLFTLFSSLSQGLCSDLNVFDFEAKNVFLFISISQNLLESFCSTSCCLYSRQAAKNSFALLLVLPGLPKH